MFSFSGKDESAASFFTVATLFETLLFLWLFLALVAPVELRMCVLPSVNGFTKLFGFESKLRLPRSPRARRGVAKGAPFVWNDFEGPNRAPEKVWNVEKFNDGITKIHSKFELTRMAVAPFDNMSVLLVDMSNGGCCHIILSVLEARKLREYLWQSSTLLEHRPINFK